MTSQTERIAEAVGTIFGALSSDGAEAFERLCLDNGLLWRCHNKKCRANVPIDCERCTDCDTLRRTPDDHEYGDPIA